MMCGVIENVDNLEAMKARLGIDYARVSYGAFVKCFDAVDCDRLTGGARACHNKKGTSSQLLGHFAFFRNLIEFLWQTAARGG